MRWLIRIGMVVVALVVMVLGIGAALPRDHVAAVSAVIPAPPDQVHARIVDITTSVSWRSDLDSVAIVSASPPRWREMGEFGPIEYIRETDRPDLVVSRIAGPRTDFGGLWRYEIGALPGEPGSTRVTIVEEGEVYSALYRFFSRFVFGQHGTMERYLRDLGSSFGVDVRTERVN